MPYERNTGLLILTAIITSHVLIATTRAGAVGPFDELVERIQNDPRGTREEQRTFVENSLKYVQEGADRAEIVNALASIAMAQRSRYSGEALAALAFIGDNLEGTQTQEMLLRIITTDGTPPSVRKTAARYLELEADEPIRTRLLEFVKTRWGSMIPTDAAMVLYHCGDTRYLRLLEEEFNKAGAWQNGEDAAEKSRMYRLEIQLRQMRLAKRPLPEIVTAIASADNAYDRQYLVRQGARRGADPKPYGAAVVKFLGLPEELTKWAWNGPLIEDCHRLGLFTPEEAKKFPAPVHRPVSHSKPSIVPWATGYEGKWLSVHSFKKSDAAED